MLESLRSLLPGKVSTAPADLEAHGKDEGYPLKQPPLAVVYAEKLSDVQAALAWARENRVPVIPFGAGTSLEGQLIPQGQALSLDLSRMNRILQIAPEDFLAVVEPGLTRKALNEALKGTGLFFPVDPGADASLGGMAATNASGTTTVRYGGMRPNVLALQVVLVNGEVLELGRGVRKTSAGYDLKDLFIGSEGTLGVITRLTLRLHPLPEHVHTLRVFFGELEAAAQAAYSVMASGLPVARLELVDARGIAAINRYLERNYPEKPALFVEFHSSTREALQAESELALGLMQAAGALSVSTAYTQEERTAQWEARHQAYWALVNLYPGKAYLSTDSAVPLSKMPALVAYASRLLAEMDLPGSILGHVGDGNFHSLVVFEPGEAKAEAFSEQLVEHTLALGGTCTGEHGVGLRKKKFLPKEHGPALLWMRQIKRLFDPEGLLNPGKIFD
ncbi:MAG: FAD-binding oxidoreductase [Meiothermus sp.]|uniref:FAD-binding oxidoreductase n=1 Tax=Meiothermus sp. TaxID=1955249 RepID=UPI0025FFD293|nr:FAD-binding oxidoreductase [Meiothermus sp.]MCS7058243.1 FAD-binding oxidoreductase [Meiothermus sp.]MCS7194411.1 FAD-binding oxidoreductase [Meiothermus sp.]MCX7740567.1 FAD-binding oxidoreductase [Meiothermus sp.]MDW8089892.1 FAD-binding oxidoreductase [Meiothermus sp.]MDW8481681.1 FAD-binding oxidoreductase [Meiothermus sp.]